VPLAKRMRGRGRSGSGAGADRRARIYEALCLSGIPIRRLCALLPLLVGWPPVAAYANFNCQLPRYHFVNEGVTPVGMWVREGAGCKFHFQIPASVYGLAGILSSTVTLRPKNGLLGKNTIRIYAYKPNDGFVGSDEFELKVRYDRDDDSGEHTTLLHVNVTVSP
jgi:hypothetical protein